MASPAPERENDPLEIWRSLQVSGVLPHLVHKLNNGLAVAPTVLDSLRPALVASPALTAQLDLVIREIERARALMIELARYAAASAESRGSIDVVELFRRVIVMLGPVSQVADHPIELDVGPGAMVVEGDSDRYVHVLVTAALELFEGPAPSRAELQVQKRGRLVARFRRVDGTVRIDLRLARGPDGGPVRREVVAREALDGLARELGIGWSSRSWRGRVRVIRLRLPAVADDRGALGEDWLVPAAEPSVGASTPSILVADGDHTISDVLREVLEQHGYAVDLVEDRTALAERLANGGTAVALVDRGLIGDGEGPVRDLLEIASGTRVLLMGSLPPLRGEIPTGARFLLKPIRPGELLAAVQHALPDALR